MTKPGELRQLGQYDAIESLWHGVHGSIYKAADRSGRIVALRTLAQSESQNERSLLRFYQEAKLAMRLDHPNLLRVFEVGEDRGIHFMAMEHVEGESLLECIRRNGRFDERYAVRVIAEVAQALGAMHDFGLLHRNIRPSNVLLCRDGGVKLLDLGLAKDLQADLGVTISGQGLGSPNFVAPEQFRSAQDCTIAADIYGLGAVLYSMVTGKPPFSAGGFVETLRKKLDGQYVPPERMAPHLSSGVIRAIRWSMVARPAARPQDTRAFVAALNGEAQSFGDYELLEQIGHGSSGSVYRARSAGGRIVAIKLLEPEAARDRRRLLRFYQEAKLAMLVDHPNVVRTLEVGEQDGRHAIVMEHVDGKNLACHIKQTGRLPEADALRIIVDVAQGLDAAHRQGIVHRNISPSNILLTRAGGAKLCDLGLAKCPSADIGLTQSQSGLGTPNYMAPEQFRDARNVDARADVYALAATLYAMMTGRHPFHRRSLAHLFTAKNHNDLTPPENYNPAISRQTASLIKRCLDPRPSRRCASALAFRRHALGCTESRPKKKRRTPLSETSSARRRRSLRGAGMASAIGILACIRSFFS